jgi:uncharacterized protein
MTATHKLPIALAAFATLVFTTSPASAAAFDCNYAKLPTEVLICQDSELNILDEYNGKLFYKIAGQLSSSGRTEFMRVGHEWIVDRNRCGYDRACVAHAYASHMQRMCLVLYDTADATACANAIDEKSSDQAPALPVGSYLLGTIGVDAWDPDPYLALRSDPTTMYGQRLEKMSNGSVVSIIEKQDDGWWFVQDLRSGLQGWAKSGAGYDGQERAWIHTAE